MERREFLTSAALAGVTVGALNARAEENNVIREYYEHRVYHLLPGDRNGLIHTYLEKAAIPAWNRLGIGPVGVFTGVYGGEWTDIEVLLPHPNFASVLSSREALANDNEFQQEGAAFINAGLDHPEFVRYESSLMQAFVAMPKMTAPPKAERIFELRTYESHCEKYAQKKIDMFNEGGEIEIFLETGLTPVFFGETLIGPRMPNLTYMVVFDDMADHDASWDKFRTNDKWKALSSDEQYKDTVSNIHNRILKPLGYSQI